MVVFLQWTDVMEANAAVVTYAEAVCVQVCRSTPSKSWQNYHRQQQRDSKPGSWAWCRHHSAVEVWCSMFWVPHFLCQFSFVVGNEPASCFFNCLHKGQAHLCHKIYMKSMPFFRWWSLRWSILSAQFPSTTKCSIESPLITSFSFVAECWHTHMWIRQERKMPSGSKKSKPKGVGGRLAGLWFLNPHLAHRDTLTFPLKFVAFSSSWCRKKDDISVPNQDRWTTLNFFCF